MRLWRLSFKDFLLKLLIGINIFEVRIAIKNFEKRDRRLHLLLFSLRWSQKIMIIPRKCEQCEWKNRNLSVATPELYFLKKGSLSIIFYQMIIIFPVAHWTPSTFCVAVWIGWLYPDCQEIDMKFTESLWVSIADIYNKILKHSFTQGVDRWVTGWRSLPILLGPGRPLSQGICEKTCASRGQGAARSMAYNDPQYLVLRMPRKRPV